MMIMTMLLLMMMPVFNPCRPQGGKGNTKPPVAEPTAEEVYIDMILSRHARKLLSTNQLATLGAFAANMDDFHLVSWLKRERSVPAVLGA